MKKIVLLIGLFFLQQLVFSQSVEFIIKDSLSNEALMGVSVIEKASKKGASADENGKVKFDFHKQGNFNFTLTCVGYKTHTISITLVRDTTINVYLSSNGTLEEVTISSVRTNSTIENIPTRIEVLGLEDVNEENGIKPGNIMSLLGDVAGIQMQQVSASSGNTYARIQGLNGRYTQILRDGLPLFGGMSSGFSIMQIPPLDLKQIEIIKGCGSTLYGADAIGGIINLVSKNPTKNQELSLTLNQTSLLETNLNLYASKRYKNIGYTFFFGRTVQKQMDIDDDGLSDVPSINTTVIHPKLVFYLSPKSTLTLNYAATLDKRKGGDMNYFHSSNDTLYHITNSSQRHSGDIKWKYEFSKKENFTAKVSTNFLSNTLNTKYYNLEATQNIYYSELSYFKSYEKMDWVGGINYNGDIFKNKTSELPQIQDYNYNTLGFFIQNTWQIFDKISLESGFREDRHSIHGFFALPRLAVMYKLTDKFTMRINGGLGYKIPTLYSYLDPETDLKNNFTGDLKPELSQGANADINYQHSFDKLNLTINQSFFITNLNKAVYDSSSTLTKIALVNADKSLVTRGLHTYIRLEYDDMELYLGYVYTDVRQKYDALHLTPMVTPKHNISMTYFYELTKSFRFGIESSFIANQLNDNYHQTKDYVIMAAMLQYNFSNFTVVLNGENLLDIRQGKYERIYEGTINNPIFHKLWSPIDGRVINLSIKWTISE